MIEFVVRLLIQRGPGVLLILIVWLAAAAAAQPARAQALAQSSACAEIEFVQVPNVVGQRLNAIDQLLQDKCLVVGNVRYQPSDKAAGAVISQTPVSGAWSAPGSPIHLVVAEAPGQSTTGAQPGQPPLPAQFSDPTGAATGADNAPGRRVPDLTCRSLRDAGQILAREALQLGRVRYTRSARCPNGGVVAQTPRPGGAAAGGAVDVVLAEGSAGAADATPAASCPPSIRVPKVVGVVLEQAERILTERCLVLGSVRRERSDQPAGTVIVQGPSPGAGVAPGRVVDLVVAAGADLPPSDGGDQLGAPSATAGEVPELLGLTITQATPQLREQGLRLGRVRREISLEPAGTIIGQVPEPGQPLGANGGRVDITIAESIVVPDLRRLTEEQAGARLEQSLLELGEITTVPADQPAGTVVNQWPVPGMPAEAGQEVDVALAAEGGQPPAAQASPPGSTGPPALATGPTPDLRALSLAEAGRRLAEAGLRQGTITNRPASEPPGTVLEQDPPPGAPLAPGTQVNLTLAQAAEVPTLTGVSLEDARQRLASQGLDVGAITEKISSAPAGQVLEQVPAAGAAAPANRRVDITIAAALTAPPLVGMTLDAAGSTLATRLLQLGTVTERADQAAPGTIIEQTPAAGATVPIGGAIAVTVAVAPEVPDLTGLTQAQAESRLAALQLDLGEVTYEPAIGGYQTILRQTPAAGTPATAGLPVSVVLAVPAPTPPRPTDQAEIPPPGDATTGGIDTIEAPSIVGLDLKQARELLEIAGLQIVTDAEPADPSQAQIVAQTPGPTAPVRIGGTIRVQLAAIAPGAETAGPGAGEVVVPNLVGLSNASVETLLAPQRLQLGQQSWQMADAEPGTVLSQVPPAGSTVPAGQYISVTLAAATTVPDLVGLDQDSAAPLLISQSLQLGTVDQVFALNWPGTIVGQTPPPGAPVDKDIPVNVKIAGSLIGPVTIGGGLLLAVAGFVWLRPRLGGGGVMQGGMAPGMGPLPGTAQRRPVHPQPQPQPSMAGPPPITAPRAQTRRPMAAPPGSLSLNVDADLGRQVIRTDAAELVLPTIRVRGRADLGEQAIENA